MREKLEQEKTVQEQEKMDKENRESGEMLGAPSDFGGSSVAPSFDSGAPIDLSETTEETTETAETPIEEGPTEGEGSETLPTPPGGETPIE